MVAQSMSTIYVNPNSVAIIGWSEGAAGQIHSWLEKSTNYSIACFVNVNDVPLDIDAEAENKKRDTKIFDYPSKNSFKDKPLINASDWIKELKRFGIKKVLVATVDNRERLEHIRNAKDNKFELINAIHPSATILEDAVLHDNIIVHSMVVIGYRSEIHSGVSINTGSQLDHHNVVHKCATVDPGVVTAGNVTIGECSYLHTGVVVKNKIRIGMDSIVGAGSVIIDDVPDRVTIMGVPGRVTNLHSNHKD